MQKVLEMNNHQTERNKILAELMQLAEKPEHLKYLIDLSTDASVDLIARNEQLKTQVQVLKNERDWMFNKVLERVNRK